MATSRKRKLATAQAAEHQSTIPEQTLYIEPPYSPATLEEQRDWQGFCEIENEPAIFNAMLKSFGVKGLRVTEIFDLEHLLKSPDLPVYGLIFLYRYEPSIDNKQESSCPDHIWFANQTHDHACATVALLNIVNNIPGIELGENLCRFKDFTEGFPPSLRGDQIGNFEFLKQIHNSYARKIEMMNIDLSLENQYDERNKSKKAKKGDEEEEESAFHFIAFLPIEGEVWKLDGLDRQPEKLGDYSSDDWLSVAVPYVSAQMVGCEARFECSLLSLTKDPVRAANERLIQAIASLKAVEAQLQVYAVERDTECHILSSEIEDLGTVSPHLDISNVEPKLPDSLSGDIIHGKDMPELVRIQEQLFNETKLLIRLVVDEMDIETDYQQKADDAKRDYGPLIYVWFRMLAENGAIKPLLDQLK